MRIQITARHCDVRDAERERAEGLIQRLQRFDSHLSHAELIFEVQKQSHSVEGVLSLDRQEPVVAKGEGSDFVAALDELVERLGRILKKRHSRRVDHRSEKPAQVGEGS